MLAHILHSLIQRPLLLLIALVIIIAAGLQGWQRMPVDLLPKLDVPVINIITHLPGASPQDIDTLISRPIEAQMQGVIGLHRIASTSAQGISQVSIQFDWGSSVQNARQLVQARLSQLTTILPQGVRPRLESIGSTLQEVAGYIITSPSDPIALTHTVRYQILPRLSHVKGVSFAEILGGEQRAFVVSLKPEALIQQQLQLNDISKALALANHVEVAGFSDQGGREWLVRTDGRAVDLDDLAKMVVGTNQLGRPILLSEIGTLRETQTPKHYAVHGDGKPAVVVFVRKQPGASALDVVQQLDLKLKDLNHLLPAGVSIKKFYDQSEIIAQAKHEIVQDLWVGAVLVVGVLYFFLGSIRPTLVVALSIPITLLASLVAMQWLGLSLNIITMTALALAIGMVVDDAIIVAENIARHATTTNNATLAAIDGTAEIVAADASGTFTTVVAFLPLLLLGGMASLFLQPFAWTISIALLVSLAVSLTMVPILSAQPFFQANSAPRALGDRFMRRSKIIIFALLAFFLPRRKVFIFSVFILLGLAFVASATGRINILPPLDEGSILVEYIMPPGTSLKESHRIGNKLERLALTQANVSTVYRRTGSPLSGYQIEGVNRGEMMIKLKPRNQRTSSATEIMARFKHLYASFSGMSLLYHQPTQEKMDESFSGLPALFGVTIYGDNEDTLIHLASLVQAQLEKNPDISNIVNNTNVRSNQITVRLHHGALAQYGLTANQVMDIVRAAGLGLEVTQVIHGQESIPVLLRWQGIDLQYPDKIANLPVPLNHGGWVPLNKVADIVPAAVASNLTRLNGQQEITLLAEADGDLLSIARQVEEQLARLNMPAGYSATVSGQYQVLMDTAAQFLWVALAAILLIYLIMVMQFSSWLQPLAILAAIPIALAGGLICLRFAGQSLDVSAGMAALTLIGIAVNNGIVLLDFVNRSTQQGLSSVMAWQQAINTRIRPVLLTAITTIASLLPLAIGLGGASEIFKPFAVTVIGGLITATFGSFIFLPVLLMSQQTENNTNTPLFTPATKKELQI